MAQPVLVNGVTGVNATPQFVSGPGAKLMDFVIFNAAAATSFISFYDSAIAPTVGTTVPKWQVGITTLGTVPFPNTAPDGLFFRDGLWVAATTTSAGNTNPATPVVISLGVN